MGLGTCWCGVFPNEDRIKGVRKVLGLDESCLPFNVIAVGVPDENPEPRGFFEKDKVQYM